jgi:hypothetical protein
MNKPKSFGKIIVVVSTFILLLFPFNIHSLAEEEKPNYHIPEGIYIEMTREFYEALKEESNRRSKTYSNDSSLEYLKQISINSKFMVETNLQVIKLQEEILSILESLLDEKKK